MTKWVRVTIVFLLVAAATTFPVWAKSVKKLEARLAEVKKERNEALKNAKDEQQLLSQLADEETKLRQELALLFMDDGGLADGRVANVLTPLVTGTKFFNPSPGKAGFDSRILGQIEANASRYPVLLGRLYFLRIKQLTRQKNYTAAKKLIKRALPHCEKYLLSLEANILYRRLHRLYKLEGDKKSSEEAWRLAFAHVQRIRTPSIFGIDPLSMRDIIPNEPKNEQRASWFGLPKKVKVSTAPKDIPIYSAIRGGRYIYLESVIKSERDFSLLLQKDSSAEVALHLVARNDNKAMFDFVCQRTPKGDYRNNKGDTPLHVFTKFIHCQSDKSQRLHYLNELLKPCPIDGQNSIQFTALHYLCEAGALELVKVLLKKGANPSLPNLASRTPLHCAATRGHREVVRELAAAGANVNCKDILGTTPLHTAALGGDARMIETLLDVGADRKLRDNEGLRPIDHLMIEKKTLIDDAPRKVSMPFLGAANSRSLSASSGSYKQAKLYLSTAEIGD